MVKDEALAVKFRIATGAEVSRAQGHNLRAAAAHSKSGVTRGHGKW
jgi:hypothetical protein